MKEVKQKIKKWILKYKSFVIILVTLLIIILIIHFFGWWDALGILFIKFGLGLKVSGAKTFTTAIAKAGGKKVLLGATAGMLFKRHLIDVFSKFFAENSISKFKKTLTDVLKLKVKEFKETSFMKKAQAFGALFLSIPGVYFLWTKVISVAIQKLVYGFVFTLLTFIWNIISGFFNIIAFVLEIIAFNVLLDKIASYKWGQVIVKIIDKIVYFVADVFFYINNSVKWFFSLFGIYFDFKGFVIRKSVEFNNYLVSILEKNLTKMTKIQNKRDRYVNVVERISEKRYLYLQNKRNRKKSSKISFKDRLFRKKKQKTWREKREEKLKKQKEKRDKYVSERRKKAQKKETPQRVNIKLTLAYHDMVRWGDVPFRAK